MLKILSSISETGISELKPHTTPVVVGILGNELRDEISLSLSLSTVSLPIHLNLFITLLLM